MPVPQRKGLPHEASVPRVVIGDSAEILTPRFPPRGLLRRFYPLLAELWQFLDAVVVVGSMYAVSRIYDVHLHTPHAALAIVTVALMIAVYSWSDLFYRLRSRTLLEEGWRLLRAWSTVLICLVVLGYVTAYLSRYEREFMMAWAGTSFVAQLLVHILVREALHLMRRHGVNLHRVMIVGCGPSLEQYVRYISRNPWLGIEVVGFVAEPHWLSEVTNAEHRRRALLDGVVSLRRTNGNRFTADRGDFAEGGDAGLTCPIAHLGGLGDIHALVDRLAVGEICVTLPLDRSSEADTVMQALIDVPVNVTWIPDFTLAQVLSTRADTLGGRPVVLLSDSRIDRHGQLFKRLEDIVVSSLLILTFAPLMGVIAWLVRRSSPGPTLFRQKRYGFGGRPIEVWKFRTMYVAESSDTLRQAVSGDARITPVGKWLRRWSLDELPQLFNVLLGDMSIVGPRPHPLWLDDRFVSILDGYMQRHRVKPGLTGWAQVHGLRGETDTHEKMEKRFRHDLYYITHWSPLLDLQIIFRTVPAVLLGKNAY